jgi:hypothetical protein
MYMNYMDFTSDACINMFTRGQKNRMRALFNPGGIRSSLLSSRALGEPVIDELPAPEPDPRWLHVKLFPNPAASQLTVDLAYDARWIGREMIITNSVGLAVIRSQVSSKIQSVDISRLKPGVYFLRIDKEGESIRQKFVKL